LSIARGLVELHGGTIEAASPPDGGTEMRIRLPIGTT
jgi:signal transduction histidine kinase